MRTTTQAKAARLAVKLAALADPARNANEAERASALAKLIALCEKHGLDIAEFVKPVASPEAEPVQPEAKADPKPKAAKPAAEADTSEADRAKANREATMRHYDGASQASHATRAPKLSEALARVATPIQRAKSASTRDESGLLLATKHANGKFDFCPLAATFDLGVLSRLASLGLIVPAPCGQRVRITKAGRDLAANIARKAA